ncbi:MAG TPA: universal stress protein [bacterium]|nr:universal stress protein [bacterium]
MKTMPRWTAIKVILAPTDLSPGSAAGVIRASELARSLGANLIVMTAIPWPGGTERTEFLDQALDAERMRLAAWFAAYVPSATREGVAVRFLVVAGTPAHAILEAAETDAVDLIVMATHRQSGLSRLIHGSVAEAVVRAGERPVLTIGTNGAAVRKPAAA